MGPTLPTSLVTMMSAPHAARSVPDGSAAVGPTALRNNPGAIDCRCRSQHRHDAPTDGPGDTCRYGFTVVVVLDVVGWAVVDVAGRVVVVVDVEVVGGSDVVGRVVVAVVVIRTVSPAVAGWAHRHRAQQGGVYTDPALRDPGE